MDDGYDNENDKFVRFTYSDGFESRVWNDLNGKSKSFLRMNSQGQNHTNNNSTLEFKLDPKSSILLFKDDVNSKINAKIPEETV